MRKTASISVFLTIGILILGLGLFAGQLGLDPNPGWSKRRVALIILGLLIALAPWILHRRFTKTGRLSRSDLFTLPVLLLVVGVYFWFITISHGTTSTYYSLLAFSFRNGELSLPLKPDSALLQLPNPYDPAARQGIRVPQDLSLYNGRFYLYWGPAPSVLLAILQPLLPGRLAEVDLLFLFTCGIFLAQYILLMYLWERFFPAVPRWILVLSILLAGFANPVLWMLSQPKIYEAAIAGAQFFFIAGFVSAVLSLGSERPSRWSLALAGACWALAVGTRSVAVFAVLFMTIMVMYQLFRLYRHSFVRFVGELLPLGLTLFAGALGFVWYNWVRFGSLLETGFTYQLAAPYLQKHLHELFLPSYIFQNLYNYVLNPFLVKPPFPFLYPIRGRIEAILPWQLLPELYTAQAITGFLFGVPFLIYSILPVAQLVKQLFYSEQTSNTVQNSGELSLLWITTSLFGSFLLPFLSLLAFFWAAMRYSEDFMPALVVLSIIGFWEGWESRSRSSNEGRIYAALGGLLAVASIILAVFLALAILHTNGLLG